MTTSRRLAVLAGAATAALVVGVVTLVERPDPAPCPASGLPVLVVAHSPESDVSELWHASICDGSESLVRLYPGTDIRGVAVVGGDAWVIAVGEPADSKLIELRGIPQAEGEPPSVTPDSPSAVLIDSGGGDLVAWIEPAGDTWRVVRASEEHEPEILYDAATLPVSVSMNHRGDVAWLVPDWLPEGGLGESEIWVAPLDGEARREAIVTTAGRVQWASADGLIVSQFEELDAFPTEFILNIGDDSQTRLPDDFRILRADTASDIVIVRRRDSEEVGWTTWEALGDVTYTLTLDAVELTLAPRASAALSTLDFRRANRVVLRVPASSASGLRGGDPRVR